MNAGPVLIAWEAHEFEHQEKSSDWYWGLGVIALVCAVTALFFNNVILAILIIVAALVLGVVAQAEPTPTQFAIHQRGIMTDDVFYPFSTLESFWIDTTHDKRHPRLLVKSEKFFMPLLVIPLDGVDPEEIEEALLGYLPLEHHDEPISHRLFEKLGF